MICFKPREAISHDFFNKLSSQLIMDILLARTIYYRYPTPILINTSSIVIHSVIENVFTASLFCMIQKLNFLLYCCEHFMQS